MMMTSRERWLAALRHEPVDCLPFWPKVNGAYTQVHREPYRSMSIPELHAYIGSDPQCGLPSVVREYSCSGGYEDLVDGHTRTTKWSIRDHELVQVHTYDPASASWHPMTFPIRSREDIEIMTEWYRDRRVELSPEGVEKALAEKARINGDGMVVGGIDESPLMKFVEHLAGVEMAHYFLADCLAEVEALFDVMHELLKKTTDIACAHHPAELQYLIENTSTTLISPTQYRAYCYPQIMEYATIANSHGKQMALHMCGHLKLLLPDLEKLPVAVFEAFTSPTVGNTTLLDGRSQCPTKCLIGGTNAWLWTRSKDEIIRQLDHDLGQLPHHRGLILSSAGVMPPVCPPETIKAVCEWIHQYPVRN